MIKNKNKQRGIYPQNKNQYVTGKKAGQKVGGGYWKQSDGGLVYVRTKGKDRL